MNRNVLFLVLLISLICAPALLACEKCIEKGDLDPLGNGPYSTAFCYSGAAYDWSVCWGGATTCTKSDDLNSCPVGGDCSENPANCVLNQSLRGDPSISRNCDDVDVSGRCTIRDRTQTSFLR
jgi:hypothetical protein